MQQLLTTSTVKKEESEETSIEENDFTSLFDTYYKRVYNYIYYRVNCSFTTEDLTSQVFEKVLLKINTYNNSKAPIEVWIITIAKNVLRDYFRSLKRHKFFSLDMIKELVGKERNPEEMIVREEMNNNLLKALNTLKKRERNIVALKFGANLKNKEIAQILKLTESNVGIILYRAIKKLKSEFESEELK